MQNNKAGVTVIVRRCFSSQSIDQLGVVVGTSRDPRVVFRFAYRTKHDQIVAQDVVLRDSRYCLNLTGVTGPDSQVSTLVLLDARNCSFKRNLFKVREAFEIAEAVIDFFLRESLHAFGSELLDIE